MLIEGGSFVSEDVADEAVVGLFWVDFEFFLFFIVQELKLLLEGVPHFDISFLFLYIFYLFFALFFL